MRRCVGHGTEPPSPGTTNRGASNRTQGSGHRNFYPSFTPVVAPAGSTRNEVVRGTLVRGPLTTADAMLGTPGHMMHYEGFGW